MARFDGGWVKIQRKALLGDINSNYARGGLFCALVGMANLERSTVSWHGKPRDLERGEIVTSFKELAELGGVDRKTVKKHLEYLHDRETIHLEVSTQGVLIRLINFGKHQNGASILDDGMDDASSDLDNGSGILDKAMAIGMVNGVPHIEEYNNIRIKEVVATVSDEQKELVKNITNRIFEITGDSSFSRHALKLIERFKTEEEFALFLEELVESSGKAKTKPQRRTYLKTAILREIGAIRESSAG